MARWLKMRHPALAAEYVERGLEADAGDSIVTEKSFVDLWEPKGWTKLDDVDEPAAASNDVAPETDPDTGQPVDPQRRNKAADDEAVAAEAAAAAAREATPAEHVDPVDHAVGRAREQATERDRSDDEQPSRGGRGE